MTFVLILLVSGFVASMLLAAEPVFFSHQAHLDEGAECASCHQLAGSKKKLGWLRDACEECHDDGPPSAWRLPAKARGLKIRFSHRAHGESVECIECHKNTVDQSQPSGEPVMGYERCIACHRDKQVEVSEQRCTSCHGTDPRRLAPRDHRQAAWMKRHGEEARWRVFELHGQACALCHRSQACLTCHRTSRPQSHTALWRMRTHGVSAAWDRQGCRTCHEAGTCIRCHRSVAPLNHKGSWRITHGLAAQALTNRHCAVCHRPAWCAACHLGATSP